MELVVFGEKGVFGQEQMSWEMGEDAVGLWEGRLDEYCGEGELTPQARPNQLERVDLSVWKNLAEIYLLKGHIFLWILS